MASVSFVLFDIADVGPLGYGLFVSLDNTAFFDLNRPKGLTQGGGSQGQEEG